MQTRSNEGVAAAALSSVAFGLTAFDTRSGLRGPRRPCLCRLTNFATPTTGHPRTVDGIAGTAASADGGAATARPQVPEIALPFTGRNA